MNTNTVLIGATFVMTLANTTGLVVGVLYARKRMEAETQHLKQQIEQEVSSTKEAVNKTVKGFAKVLEEFEV